MSNVFLPVFFATFGLVCVYLACVFGLSLRLRSARVRAKGYDGPDPFSFLGSVAFIGWVFSDKHRSLGDELSSKLIWAVRLLFVILVPLYVFLFSTFWFAN